MPLVFKNGSMRWKNKAILQKGNTLMFKEDVEMKYLIEAVLDEGTIKKGVARLKKNKDFDGLKKQYEAVKQDLIDSLSLSEEKASSIINYAIHT